MFFFFTNIYKIKIRIPSFVSSKDPKTLLLNSIENFKLYKSYKAESVVDLSFPQKKKLIPIPNPNPNPNQEAEVVAPVFENEWMLLNSKGLVSKEDINSKPIVKYNLTVRSSIFSENIKTYINIDNENVYINFPETESTLGDSAPIPWLVSIPKEKLDQIKTLLPQEIQEKLDKLDLLKIFPNNSLNYLNSPIAKHLNELIASMTIAKNGEEEIHGINTDHYSINIEKSSLNKFLVDVSGNFFVDQKEEEKISLDKTLNSIAIDSFDIWIGKKDNNLYQDKFVLSIPLSAINDSLDTNDKDKKIVLGIQTTYYEFNVHNYISVPSGAVDIDNYMKNIEDMNLRNEITSFAPLALAFKETFGNFGNKSNKDGSCASPVSGSLFSIKGHKKGGEDSINKIEGILNNIITKSILDPICYSTPKAWAISSHRISDSNYYFCMDSEGTFAILTEAISGPVCK